MIESAQPLCSRCQRSGSGPLLHSSRAPFWLSREERWALERLIRVQRDAFCEVDIGLARPFAAEPFTPRDLAELERLFAWLRV